MTGAGRSLSTEAHAAGLFGDILFSDAKVDRAFDKTVDASGQHLGLVVTLGERVLGSCYCALRGKVALSRRKFVNIQTSRHQV